MKLSAITTCALFGGIASLYGIGIALMPLAIGLFELGLSHLPVEAQDHLLIMTSMVVAQGLSVRMLAVSALALLLFCTIAYLDWRARRSAKTAI